MRHPSFAILLLPIVGACGSSEGDTTVARNPGGNPFSGHQDAGAVDGGAAYPSGTIAFEGAYSSAYWANDYWSWFSPTDGCTYLLKVMWNLRMDSGEAIVFDRFAKTFDVRSQTSISIEGVTEGGEDALRDPACIKAATMTARGKLEISPGSYAEPLTWKGRVRLELVQAKESRDLEVAFVLDTVKSQPNEKEIEVDSRKVAKAFEGTFDMSSSIDNGRWIGEHPKTVFFNRIGLPL